MDKDCKSFIQEQTKSDFEVLKKWTNQIPIDQDSFYFEIRKILIQKIRNYILNDMNGLMQILYRADVVESKIKKALQDFEEGDAAEILASLYLDRMIEKYKTKQLYKTEEKSEWIFDI